MSATPCAGDQSTWADALDALASGPLATPPSRLLSASSADHHAPGTVDTRVGARPGTGGIAPFLLADWYGSGRLERLAVRPARGVLRIEVDESAVPVFEGRVEDLLASQQDPFAPPLVQGTGDGSLLWRFPLPFSGRLRVTLLPDGPFDYALSASLSDGPVGAPRPPDAEPTRAERDAFARAVGTLEGKGLQPTAGRPRVLLPASSLPRDSPVSWTPSSAVAVNRLRFWLDQGVRGEDLLVTLPTADGPRAVPLDLLTGFAEFDASGPHPLVASGSRGRWNWVELRVPFQVLAGESIGLANLGEAPARVRLDGWLGGAPASRLVLGYSGDLAPSLQFAGPAVALFWAVDTFGPLGFDAPGGVLWATCDHAGPAALGDLQLVSDTGLERHRWARTAVAAGPRPRPALGRPPQAFSGFAAFGLGGLAFDTHMELRLVPSGQAAAFTGVARMAVVGLAGGGDAPAPVVSPVPRRALVRADPPYLLAGPDDSSLIGRFVHSEFTPFEGAPASLGLPHGWSASLWVPGSGEPPPSRDPTAFFPADAPDNALYWRLYPPADRLAGGRYAASLDLGPDVVPATIAIDAAPRGGPVRHAWGGADMATLPGGVTRLDWPRGLAGSPGDFLQLSLQASAPPGQSFASPAANPWYNGWGPFRNPDLYPADRADLFPIDGQPHGVLEYRDSGGRSVALGLGHLHSWVGSRTDALDLTWPEVWEGAPAVTGATLSGPTPAPRVAGRRHTLALEATAAGDFVPPAGVGLVPRQLLRASRPGQGGPCGGYVLRPVPSVHVANLATGPFGRRLLAPPAVRHTPLAVPQALVFTACGAGARWTIEDASLAGVERVFVRFAYGPEGAVVGLLDAAGELVGTENTFAYEEFTPGLGIVFELPRPNPGPGLSFEILESPPGTLGTEVAVERVVLLP